MHRLAIDQRRTKESEVSYQKVNAMNRLAGPP